MTDPSYAGVYRRCRPVTDPNQAPEMSDDERLDAVRAAISGPPLTSAPSPLARQEGGGHYKDLKIQPIEYIHANGIPFAEGSVIKYVTRWRAKGGIKDLEKARHFIDLLIELESRNG